MNCPDLPKLRNYLLTKRNSAMVVPRVPACQTANGLFGC